MKAGDVVWGWDGGNPKWQGAAALVEPGQGPGSTGWYATMNDTGLEAYFANYEIFATKEDYLRHLILVAAGVEIKE